MTKKESKITIELNGRKIKLSLDEIKELRRILDELLVCKGLVSPKPYEWYVYPDTYKLFPPYKAGDIPTNVPIITWTDSDTTTDISSSLTYTI